MDNVSLANEILKKYNIFNHQIDFLRHNENMTFKVTDLLHNKRYLLRIHKPSIEGLFGIQHTYEGIKSEIEILEYLHTNSTLKVQKPFVNSSGEYVNDCSELVDFPCYSTLVEWIEGPNFTHREENIKDIAFRLGANLAILHESFCKFKPSANFKRPIYDLHRIDSTIEELKYCTKMDLISTNNYKIIYEVLTLIKSEVKVLECETNTWGIIHADIQLNNIVLNNENPCLIDFGFCGFGYYLFDLGSAGSILDSSLRKIFLEAYASNTTFSFDNIRYIEGFIFMDLFLSYVLFMKDINNTWITTSAEEVCNTLCKDFLNGKQVFYLF